MRVRVVAGVIGQLLRLFSFTFTVPIALALWDERWWTAFAFFVSASFCGALGALMAFKFSPPSKFYREEALAIVAGTWFTVAGGAAIPYTLLGLTPIDAMFESMSGFTTTGATILTDFSQFDRAFFLWRAMTQWIGGMGVIALFVVVLPRLGIAGRQLFFAEASDAAGDAVSPKVSHAARKLWMLYIGLTAVCTLGLMVSGMSLYEGVVHAFTTLAAGGFSPNPESIAGYHNPGVEWVLVLFMFLGGASFPLQVRVFSKGPSVLWRDAEFVTYTLVTIAGAVLVALMLSGEVPSADRLRDGFFQTASIISSSGFASVDYDKWATPVRLVLVMIGVIGGCAGSAAGGPKVIRHLLTVRYVLREMRQVLHPRATLTVRYGGQGLPDQALRAVITLVFLYAAGYLFFGVVCTASGMTPLDGFSASLACLGNIGPGFGVVGPMASFGELQGWLKVLLTFAMWIGRLEILAVLALLHPDVWRGMRFNGRAARRRTAARHIHPPR